MKSLTSNTPSQPVLSIARIQRPRGFTGHLRATFRGEFLEELEGAEVHLYRSEGLRDGFLLSPQMIQALTLDSVGFAGSGVAALKFAGIDTMEAAETLKGLYVGLPLDEAKRLFSDPDEPYLFQYIAMRVMMQGECVGEVLRIEESGAQQWLIVSWSGAGELSSQEETTQSTQKKSSVGSPKELMVPLNGPFVVHADFEAGEIEMVDLELLDV